VPLDETLGALVARLAAATYFEDAATALLDAMFACTDEALADRGRSASRIRLLRGVVHLRPDGTYARVFGVERSTSAVVDGVGYLTSGNVWRFIEEARCSVSIDVQRGAVRAWYPDGPRDQLDLTENDGMPGNATRERLLDRDATHVHVVPFPARRGLVEGMIALEATGAASTSDALFWGDCREELETLASVAGAFVAARSMPWKPRPAAPDELLPVVGATTARLVELLRAFAPRDETILISGPTGAGKSRLARWCHEHSHRRGQPFELLDVLGMPEDLQIPELFGWKRGAFTGAVKDNPGALARAAKGTLFLDEIDKLSLKAQAGLLHFIEDRGYRMLGDDAPEERRADVRLLVGTNADLRAAVRAGRFRDDLYYRINVLPVRLPPLDERLDELPGWADFMLKRRHREGGGTGVARFDDDAVKLLASVPWPGNLRQLDNIVRRAHALRLEGRHDAADDITIQRWHVDRALTFDHALEPATVGEVLWRAARLFVEEASRRRTRQRTLPLRLVDGFRGLVLAAAVTKTGGRDDAFALFGETDLLKNRNHHRALRRELLRAKELIGEVGGDIEGELREILDASDGSGDHP
jgi:transcriptional regulator with AAA-type ATPase domain